jgi:hypothetical protein
MDASSGRTVVELLARANGALRRIAGYVRSRSGSRRDDWRLGQSLDTQHPLDVLNGIPAAAYEVPLVPIARIRSWGGRALKATVHPLVAVLTGDTSVDACSYSNSPLKEFVSTHAPLDACGALGLDASSAPGFAGLDPRMSVYPWERVEPHESLPAWRDTVLRELGPYCSGRPRDLLDSQLLRGEAGMRRLVSVKRSIIERGYRAGSGPDGSIQAELLVDRSNDWCVLVRRGEHRAAVLASLGWDEIPIRLSPGQVIRESEVEFWYQVQAGRVTAAGARSVFRRVFGGGDDATLVNVVGWP